MKLCDFLSNHKSILNCAEISRQAGYGATLVNNAFTGYRQLSTESGDSIKEVLREVVADFNKVEGAKSE